MSSIRLTIKLFRSNLKSTSAYLVTLMLTTAMYYNFALLKYSPEALGENADSITMVICAALMSVVMLVVYFAFVWSSSRFFLNQRKKEIGLYALSGVPMGRAARVFLWDALLTGVLALVGGLALGTLVTKLFLMGGALMIKLEQQIAFAFSMPALIETVCVVMGMFTAVAFRNAWIVRRSQLIDLLQGMRVAEMPPKRRRMRAVLSVLALIMGYALSVVVTFREFMGLIVLFAIPILLLVIMGSYWAFEALLPSVLEAMTKRKNFFYRGVRMVAISNLWYRLRTNYRNLALTSVLSATAIVTLCTALTMSDYVGAREGKYDQRLYRAYSFTAWMDESRQEEVQKILDTAGIPEENIFWIHATRVARSEANSMDTNIVLTQPEAQAVLDRLMPKVNLPMRKIELSEDRAIMLSNPGQLTQPVVSAVNPVSVGNGEAYAVKVLGKQALADEVMDAWPFGSNSRLGHAVVVPEGWMDDLPPENLEKRIFLGVQTARSVSDVLLEKVTAQTEGVAAETNPYLTTEMRMLYGTLSYLGLIMFVVFSLLTGCALMFKQLSEAMVDRGKYQAMIHIGATDRELRRAAEIQVGLSLLIPLGLGVVHAAFAVNVMGLIFMLHTMGYLILSVAVYAVIVAALFWATVNRFMRIIR